LHRPALLSNGMGGLPIGQDLQHGSSVGI